MSRSLRKSLIFLTEMDKDDFFISTLSGTARAATYLLDPGSEISAVYPAFHPRNLITKKDNNLRTFFRKVLSIAAVIEDDFSLAATIGHDPMDIARSRV